MLGTIRTFCLFAGLTFMTTGLLACQTGKVAATNQVVGPESRIPIAEGGPHDGRADAGSTQIVYQYARQASSTPEGIAFIRRHGVWSSGRRPGFQV